MVSHEIRTPLNGILGTVRMLGDTRSTPTSRSSSTPSSIPAKRF